ncbi:MAG: prolipoprotein diacylglyceryl transferase [Geminicoccaceae bacterium]
MTLAVPFPQIDPVLVEIGPFAIRWYALAYIAGIVLGWMLLRRIVRQPGWQLQPAHLDDLMFFVTLGIILGGRLGFVLFYEPSYYLSHPLQIFAVWKGGMAFHGGLIGVIVAIFAFAYTRKLSPLEVGDGLAAVAPLGLLFGRIANFINGELWGRVAPDLPWGMVFPGAGPLPRHPSQLYEAFFEGLVLLCFTLWMARGTYDPERKGRIAGVFMLGYGMGRFFVEYFRQPNPGLEAIFGLFTMGQLLCLPMIAFGLFLLWRARKHALAHQT